MYDLKTLNAAEAVVMAMREKTHWAGDSALLHRAAKAIHALVPDDERPDSTEGI